MSPWCYDTNNIYRSSILTPHVRPQKTYPTNHMPRNAATQSDIRTDKEPYATHPIRLHYYASTCRAVKITTTDKALPHTAQKKKAKRDAESRHGTPPPPPPPLSLAPKIIPNNKIKKKSNKNAVLNATYHVRAWTWTRPPRACSSLPPPQTASTFVAPHRVANYPRTLYTSPITRLLAARPFFLPFFSSDTPHHSLQY